MGKKRDIIQLMRGIACIMVIVFHAVSVLPLTPVQNNINLVGNVIAMTLFFFLSGVVYQIGMDKKGKEEFKLFIKKKTVRLLFPYFSYSFVLYLIIFVANAIPHLKVILSDSEYHAVSVGTMIKSVVTLEGHVGIHLWFIYVLFFILLANYFYNPHKIGIEATIIFIISCIAREWINNLLVYRIVFYFLIFALGRYWVIESENDKTVQIKYLLGCTVLVLALGWLKPVVDGLTYSEFSIFFRMVRYGHYVILGLSGTALIWYLAEITYGKKMIKRIIMTIGNNSYSIYLLHQPYIAPVVALCAWELTNSLLLSILISVALSVLLSKVIIDCVFNKVRTLSLLFQGR